MAKTTQLEIKDLQLDLKNFRTVPQNNEEGALLAMITIAPDRFWALCESLLDSGYLPTENIIILHTKDDKLIVREGNRRIAALKLLFDYFNTEGLDIPPEILIRIKALDESWKKTNKTVPCAVYEYAEESLVDKIVALAHGKSEKAGKDNWTSVARARHNRDKNSSSEIGLGLLEKYLSNGRNLTITERDFWAGNYPLTVLNDAITRIASRLKYSSSKELTDKYPSMPYRKEIEQILKDIGNGVLDFYKIRNKNDDYLGRIYNIPPSTTGHSKIAKRGRKIVSASREKAVPANSPKSVIMALKIFVPRGKNRSKLVTLLEEARLLKLDKHPHAFCFLLRAMFELSAKAYCTDHASAGLSMKDKKGKDKKLALVLTNIVKHMTAGKKKTDPFYKSLHGAKVELNKPDGLLSITSMNELIHNPKFIIDDSHISTVFANIFPLLVEMNR